MLRTRSFPPRWLLNDIEDALAWLWQGELQSKLNDV